MVVEGLSVTVATLMLGSQMYYTADERHRTSSMVLLSVNITIRKHRDKG